MIFTKAQAKNIWCPAASVGSAIDPIRNGRTGCIADQCAFYRALDSDRGYCGGGGQPSQPSDAPIVADNPARLPREMRPASAPRKRGR
jgi:hypothetical protein